ncbi:prephenate dehydrogenase [Anaerorhabdus sp.]|uniref:prephenate dehydrogenase n=1 Tax=Anaerorhabdus sp. TaxID=1872524 RepID=UPI002FC623B3
MISQDTQFCIVGLGLLGGSYAQALKLKGYKVTAIDINADSIQYALDKGWIDDGNSDGTNLLENADCIVLGLYPNIVVDWIIENQDKIKSGCIITDVTGVKRGIVPEIQSILRGDLEFIASHPMAGREVSGVTYSDPSIFKPANFIITPTDKNSEQAISFISDLSSTLEFNRTTTLSLQQHDEMIAFLSQLTHVIAVSLMNTNDNTHLVEYTGDSFRDLTRIAKINENLWSELFIMNKDFLLKEIDDFLDEMKRFRDTLEKEDVEEMKRLFIQSTKRRKLFDK